MQNFESQKFFGDITVSTKCFYVFNSRDSFSQTLLKQSSCSSVLLILCCSKCCLDTAGVPAYDLHIICSEGNLVVLDQVII